MYLGTVKNSDDRLSELGFSILETKIYFFQCQKLKKVILGTFKNVKNGVLALLKVSKNDFWHFSKCPKMLTNKKRSTENG